MNQAAGKAARDGVSSEPHLKYLSLISSPGLVLDTTARQFQSGFSCVVSGTLGWSILSEVRTENSM